MYFLTRYAKTSIEVRVLCRAAAVWNVRYTLLLEYTLVLRGEFPLLVDSGAGLTAPSKRRGIYASRHPCRPTPPRVGHFHPALCDGRSSAKCDSRSSGRLRESSVC